MIYEVLLFLHVLGATVLLGTGAGIAFFMVMSHQSKDARLIAHVSGIVVIADTVFTATAAIAQPVTGYLLAREVGWPDATRPAQDAVGPGQLTRCRRCGIRARPVSAEPKFKRKVWHITQAHA